METARNLLTLATDSNIGDLAALEFIVGALVSKGDISSSIVCIHALSCVVCYWRIIYLNAFGFFLVTKMPLDLT